MKSILLAVFLIALSTGAHASDSLSMNYGGTVRGFWVHVPPSYTAGQHLPMVFNFHGYGSNATQEELYTQMDNTADTANFILVYPAGLNAAWNVGWVGSFWTNPDDVGFTSAIIDTMIQLYGIDTNRVYACGMSNGGYMSHLLSSVLNNRIAAIAAVSGTLTDSAAANCLLTRKIPVMDIHGTADPIVPYDSALLGVSLDVEQTISFWVGQDLCSTTSDTTFLPNTDVGDSSTVQKIDYPACAAGAEVLFYKIINGGHAWPNAIINLTVSQYGYTNHDIDANTEIWHFFNKYRLNTTTGINKPSQNENEAQVFPNPLQGQNLQIALGENMDNPQIEIFDAGGRLVYKTNTHITGNLQNIALEPDMASGVYLLRISSATNSLVRKLVKL